MRKLLLVLVLLGFFGGLINVALLGHAEGIPSDSISIDFKDIDLNDLLDIISAKTGLNIIASPEVEGKVPVARFENVPVLKALEIILEFFDYQYEIGDNIIRVSPIPLLSQNFTLKSALASEVVETARFYLSDKGKIKVNEAENQIMVTATSYNLKKIEDLIADLDTPSKQMKQEKFLIRYTSLEEIAKAVKETLSPQGTLKRDPSSSTLTVEDTSYHLFQIEKIVVRLDTFQPQKRIYKISFAPLSEVKGKIEDFLSDQGKVDEQEETSSLVVVDVAKNLKRIDGLVKQTDILEGQLVTKRFFLKYLTPQEAESELQGVISEYGKIRLPYSEETQSRSNTRDYIMIPQEGMDSPEESNPSDDKTQVENNMIYVTDLKRNMPQIDEEIKEMNGRAEEIAVRTFYIKEGSLERIAIAIANMLGVKPEEIQGIELKEEEGKWMQMSVPSLAIDLGKIGPVK